MDIVITPISRNSNIKNSWESLVDQSEVSPFVSWTWIGAWLSEIVYDKDSTYLIKICCANKVVALGFLQKVSVERRKFFKRQVLYLNELPLGDCDMVIEYNGLIAKKGFEQRAWTTLLNRLSTLPNWDEFHLNAISEIQSIPIIDSLNSLDSLLTFEISKRERVFYANTEEYDCWEKAEIGVLSSNKRSQIKRSIRAYESKYGSKVLCQKAKSTTQALMFFNRMERLHTTYWNKKGEKGAFFNKKWIHFNKKMILQGLLSNHIEIYRISVSGNEIGYIYNLVWRGIAYNIQTGFNYENANKCKPGYVSHYLVMQNCFHDNVKKYNFLVGSPHYKASLSNTSELLKWLIIRKRSNKIKFILEDSIVKLVRSLRRVTNISS